MGDTGNKLMDYCKYCGSPSCTIDFFLCDKQHIRYLERLLLMADERVETAQRLLEEHILSSWSVGVDKIYSTRN